MTEVIGVRFSGSAGKTYTFLANGIQAKREDAVIVESAQGKEFGIVSLPNHEVEESSLVEPVRKVLRIATPEDHGTVLMNREKEKGAISLCQSKIDQHKLDMKCISAEYSFDGNKILFNFIADGRVDFRDLVRDLASTFHARIELRQVGVRDEAKLLGGLGICGRPFCCSEFLDEFQPVSIKMAKEQNLSLNPTKISGTCGRLMCCLKYEQEAYEDLHRNTPRVGAQVETPDGPATVVEVALLSGKLKLRFESGDSFELKTFHKSEVGPLGSKPKRRVVEDDFPPVIFKSEIQEEEPPAEDAPQGDKPNRSRRRRRPHGHKPQGEKPQGEKPQGDKPKADAPQAEKPRQPKPQQTKDGEGKPHNNNHRRRRHRPRPKQGGEGKPQA